MISIILPSALGLFVVGPQVWDAKDCVVIKRSMATGYAGLDNPVFYKVS